MSLTGFVDIYNEGVNIPSAPAGRKLKFQCKDVALNTISIEPILMNQISDVPIMMNQIVDEPILMNQIFNEHGLMNLISYEYSYWTGTPYDQRNESGFLINRRK